MLVEGPAGTGKTELAKSVAEMTGARLIRLQCYEGLDESKALYEWNYKKQLLRIQAERNTRAPGTTIEDDIFSEEFLLTRPLLEAIRADEPVVLLIDEVDRVEIETEALLLEVLSDYQVSIPELGTIEATQIPLVFLTSNNTRELSEALKRRCLYLHIDYPDLEREKEIVLTKVPEHQREPGRPDRPHRALDPPARAEEGAVGLRDDRLGPHAGAARRRARRRASRPPRRSTSCSSTRADIAKAGKELGGDGQAWVKRRRKRRAARVTDAASPATTGRRMLDLLAGFIHELREAGLPVSLTENLDAMEAVTHIPLEDREAFKYALGATLVKNNAHWRAFETVFEVYFSLRGSQYEIVDDDGELDAPTRSWRRWARCPARRAARAAPARPCPTRSWPRCSTRR